MELTEKLRNMRQEAQTEVSECGVYTAEISLPDPNYWHPDRFWLGQIECHGNTDAEATELQSIVVEALTQYVSRPQDPIGIEAVATIGEQRIEWLVEGGIASLPSGTVLLISHEPITDQSGYGEVFTSQKTSPRDAVLDSIKTVRERYRGTEWGRAAESICDACLIAVDTVLAPTEEIT